MTKAKRLLILLIKHKQQARGENRVKVLKWIGYRGDFVNLDVFVQANTQELALDQKVERLWALCTSQPAVTWRDELTGGILLIHSGNQPRASRWLII